MWARWLSFGSEDTNVTATTQEALRETDPGLSVGPSTVPEPVVQGSLIETIRWRLGQIRSIMTRNILRMLSRGQTLEELVAKTEDLAESSAQFRRHTDRFTCWGRWCGDGQWRFYLFPCWPLCRRSFSRVRRTRCWNRWCWGGRRIIDIGKLGED